ncbi:MAG: DUF58 domain-containing protein, partial [Phycisphaeraceae bacterium]
PEQGSVDLPMNLQYEIVNSKRFLPCFSLRVEELDGAERLSGRAQSYCLHVGPGATGRADGVGWPTRRGEVRFKRIRVSTTFPFGILRKSVIFNQSASTFIFPRLHRLDRSLFTRLRSHDPDGNSMTQEADGGDEFFGLREYRPGDSLRSIHWRHSARTGRLVSREMSKLSPPRLMVVLDVRNSAAEDEKAEEAISFAASVANEAYRLGEEVGLAVVGARCPKFLPQRARWHQLRMLQALGELRLGEPTVVAAGLPMVRDARWIVIHAGAVDNALVPGTARHLTAHQLAEYRLSGGSVGGVLQPNAPMVPVVDDAEGPGAEPEKAGAS